jgi:2-hydroxychromene-2-carboxylate isomerase/alkylhydroperoxidase family enzyme
MRWYFDFISPYAYLQSTQLDSLTAVEPVECVPVLFAGLLNHWENVGPAEVSPKRDWTFKRVSYLAYRKQIPLNLPAHHPFNPLPLLRLSIALGNEPALIQRLFRYVWAEGNLPEGEPFEQLLNELNTDNAAINHPDVKAALLSNGSDAAARGVFGVPSIECGSEIFWGYDATDMAVDYLQQNDWPTDQLQSAMQLPQGLQRKTAPAKKSATANSVNSGTRVPLLPLDLQQPADLVAAIRERRGGELLELDRLLLHSPPLAEGWNALLGNVRTRFSVKQQYRELAMCTVAVVNGADYELGQHAPIYIRHGGSEQKVEALKNLPGLSRQETIFEEKELLTIRLTEQMTRDIRVSDALFEQCMQAFDTQQLVELVATVAAYNMVSRFLVALNLH